MENTNSNLGGEIMEEQLEKIIKLLEDNKKAVLSLDETANYIGIGKTRLLEIIHKPDTDFPYFRNGKKILVSKRVLDEWLEKVSVENRTV